MSQNITIYTDGAASGNPGPGGFGTIMKSGPHLKKIAKGFRRTTNNRMELLAIIEGLEAIKIENANVLVVSDSKYVIDSVTKGWVFGWQKKGFKGKKNPDLWLRFLKVYPKHHIKFKWVKGHAGHPENEMCDAMAVNAGKGKNLPPDTWYEQNVANQ